MSILILGGTGVIGNSLLKYITDTEVVVTSRKKHVDYGSVKYLQCDAKNIFEIKKLLNNKKYKCIIDCMKYTTQEFLEREDLLLQSCEHYIFLSSGRVYSDSNERINENSLRIIDVNSDYRYLKSNEYAVTKCRQEDALRNSIYNNWTIVRPYITYGYNRLQFTIYENNQWLSRVFNDLPIVVPENMLCKRTTLTSSDDVAYVVSNMIDNKNTFGEVYNLCSSENRTWNEVFEIYKSALVNCSKGKLNPQLIEVPAKKFKLCNYKYYYDRIYNREFDNLKIKKLIGNDFEFISLNEGITKAIEMSYKEVKEMEPSWRYEAIQDRAICKWQKLNNISTYFHKFEYIKNRVL